jgi:peptidoglycan/xylan/chitin deacetylase (PgdA/CDA1 family)
MNRAELKALGEGGLIEIGAHSVSHLVLAAQPISLQQEEINGSKRQLEDFLGRAVTSFAYPYGCLDDINKNTIQLVRQAGFELACTSVAKFVSLRSSLFTLPRYTVRDWNGDEFAKRLRRAFSI